MRETRNNTLKVVIEDVNNHPHCPHGPTILFDRDGEQFFACSYCRDKTDCNFYMRASDWPSQNRRILQIVKKNKRPNSNTPFLSHSASNISFCDSCLKVVNKLDADHHRDHKLLPLTQHAIDFPTSFLPPLSNDKCEAQYFFALPTLRTFEQIFRKAKINKVVCIGAPRLHEFLKNECGIKSVLLDIDQRFRWFNDEKTYFHYNMFNDHFFDGDASRNAFEEFLKEDANERLCLFTDPPFAGRTEPIFYTLKEISNRFRQINGVVKILPIMWVFPYFMETYIARVLPELTMIDFHIDYANHDVYNNNVEAHKTRKQGSPVRLFTNIRPELIVLPQAEGYSFCTPCGSWVSRVNKHCHICQTCPSKNGSQMVHCRRCSVCVKPSYVHCDTCGRCTQKVGHECGVYQPNLTCWICRRKGHSERKCQFWMDANIDPKSRMNTKGVDCWLCGGKGHNLLVCPERAFVLREEYFLGEYTNRFSKT